MILTSPIDTPGMSFETVAGILGQLLAVSVVGGATASVALRVLRIRGDHTPGAPEGPESRNVWFGAPERWLFVLSGFVLFSVVCMLLHIATRGAIFGGRSGVPLIAGVLLITWLRTKPFVDRWFLPRLSGSSGELLQRLLPALLLAATLFWIFILPALLAGSSVRTGDPPWHLGWTEQLLHGQALPSGPAPEFGTNAYPWGLHAVMGTLARLVPGTSPLTSLETLHVLVVFALPLAAACLVRTMVPRAGWYAAGAASLLAGFGWVGARDPHFATSPSDARFGADLVVASPNSVYELFPPGLPRELGVVLAAACLLLLFSFRRNHEPRVAIGGGVIAGLAGLISVPMFVVAVVWIACVAFVHPGQRLRLSFRAGGAALATFLLWSIYPLFQALTRGGFVNITPRLGMEWDLPTAFLSWGLLLPLAVFGAVRFARLPAKRLHPLLAVVAGTVVLLGLAVLRGVFDWDLAGNATLLHQGRVWPAAHLLAAAFAGAALVHISERVSLNWRAGAAGVVGLVFAVGMASLLIARGSLHVVMEAREAGYEYGSPDIRDDSGFLSRAAPFLGPDDVVEVEGSDRLAFRLFEFSGAKIARFDDERLGSNDLRIRYEDLAQAWNDRMADGGFDADFVARRTAGNGEDEEIVTSGTFGGEMWSLYATRD